jgi:hypothetical protein
MICCVAVLCITAVLLLNVLLLRIWCCCCCCSLAASECDEHCTWNDRRVFNGTAQVQLLIYISSTVGAP